MTAEGVKQLAGDAALQSAVDKVAYLKELEAGKELDGVLRVIRGDGNGPLFALLDAFRTHLHIDLSIREYTEHTLDADQQQKCLRAVLSAANNAIGDMELPELKLTVESNAKSGQADISSAVFFELVQRAARDAGGKISIGALMDLFKKTYHYDVIKAASPPFAGLPEDYDDDMVDDADEVEARDDDAEFARQFELSTADSSN
ncbi:hypothetical protein BDZ89DRAFT_1142411 [Hymenopellis radicata]|nr:hypothetical protein BDZ89DRAFT_1142411 [Hymenopellis radicata]